MNTIAYCCLVGCDEAATFQIVLHPAKTSDDCTESCIDHIGHLIGDEEFPAILHQLELE